MYECPSPEAPLEMCRKEEKLAPSFPNYSHQSFSYIGLLLKDLLALSSNIFTMCFFQFLQLRLWLGTTHLYTKLNHKKVNFSCFLQFFQWVHTQTSTFTSNTNTHLMAHQENIDQLQNHIIDKKYSLILTSQLSSGSKFNDLGFKRLTLNYKVDTCFFDFFSFFFPSSSICYFFNSIYIVFFSHFENNMSCLGLFYFFIFVKFSSFEGILFLN